MDWWDFRGQNCALTALVVDIRNSTETFNSVALETQADFLSEFTASLVAALGDWVDRQARIVDFTGDGFFVLLRDEEDEGIQGPRRAVHIARRMRDTFPALRDSPEWTGSGLNVLGIGSGIAWGPVWYGAVSPSSPPPATGVGSSVVRAFRLSQHAKDGGILVSRQTRHLLSPDITAAERPLNPELKGLEDQFCFEIDPEEPSQ